MAKPFEERFFAKIDKTDTCWLWAGSTLKNGYGQMLWRHGKKDYAHRISYEIHKGVIEKGKVIDHLCRVRHCVNPDHLEVVTYIENTRRGIQANPWAWGRSGGRKPQYAPELIKKAADMKKKGFSDRVICAELGFSAPDYVRYLLSSNEVKERRRQTMLDYYYKNREKRLIQMRAYGKRLRQL